MRPGENGTVTSWPAFLAACSTQYPNQQLVGQQFPSITGQSLEQQAFRIPEDFSGRNILLLIGGQFMEPSGLLIIVAPLVFPIAMTLGIDPIHLGIIMVVNMEIGMITPPVGLNLFVTAGVAQMSVGRVIKAALPWVGIMFLFLIVVTYVPIVSTWLPTTLMGPEVITR